MRSHINFRGEAGRCTAKGHCPFGEEENHFSSLQEATSEILKRSEEEFRLFRDGMKKINIPENEAVKLFGDLSPSQKKVILDGLAKDESVAGGSNAVQNLEGRGLKTNPELKLIVSAVINLPENFSEVEEAVVDTFKQNLLEYTPGCSGCRDPYEDYCRCKKISGNFGNFGVEDISENFLSYFSKFNYKRKSREVLELEKEFVEKFSNFAKGYHLTDPAAIHVSISGGYHGEEVDSIGFRQGENGHVLAFYEDLKNILK